MNVKLQSACRSEHGVVLDRRLKETECKEADELRAKVVKYMREHLGQFPGEDALINADMPAYVHYSSFGECIQAMSEPKTMPGEYEIIATSKTLERVIVIEDISGTETNRYGCAYSDNGTPLVVKYTRLGNDVGHYECVLRVCDSCPNPFQQILQQLSPLPKASEMRKRTRKTESAALLTSSPYKEDLMKRDVKKSKLAPRKSTLAQVLEKNSKPTAKPKAIKQKAKPKAKPKVKPKASKGRKRYVSDSSEDEAWPCIFCCEPFSQSKSGEIWIQCVICKKWAHEECSDGKDILICPNCDSDDSE